MKYQEKFILTLNCGSSSLKFSLFDVNSLAPELSGAITHIATTVGTFRIKDKDDKLLKKDLKFYNSLDTAIKEVLSWLKINQDKYPLAAIGHRLVLGGPHRHDTELVTDGLIAELNNYIYLAPNHLPEEITAITLFKEAFAGLPQIVCYDTAFHAEMPDCAKYYPLPSVYKKEGLMRYGFHGLSYEYVLSKLTDIQIDKKKIIIAHLGSGSSMVAVKNGKSIDTTMGMSPMGGLVMSTRSGDLDPGVVLFLLKRTNMSVSEADELLSRHSGLKAIAGTGDMTELLKNEYTDEKATEAIHLFCYQAKKFIGALASAMGGLDVLVFTGGIGENSATIRERICEGLEFLGISIYDKSNYENNRVISSVDSRVIVEVIPTNEEWMIANHTQQLVSKHILQDYEKAI
ncbi:acetate/propionate family kinase [Mucilaginibacter sp. BT774]|uniref:acetate/propionate family kinase n=1 Tax=Mucilaginibacter sp. BT774 TaxID=3062276 RepID=UPI0026770FA7|nr:acetate/propionate family kinase [Mucilaginibacter sp. BT774]MDO3628053.1 acetate/propionate family kinase [Mucilaginibacter sp. BT774]